MRMQENQDAGEPYEGTRYSNEGVREPNEGAREHNEDA